MIFLVLVLLTILVICDVVLVKYCNVRNGFRMFAFRIFAILLLLIFLIITGDIQIAYGARIEDFPVFHKQEFVKHINKCIPYSIRVDIKYNYDNKEDYGNGYNYNYNLFYRIDGLYDDGTCHVSHFIGAVSNNPPADGADIEIFRIPKNVLSKITMDNLDEYLNKYETYPDEVAENVGEYIPSNLSLKEKEVIKQHFKNDSKEVFNKFINDYFNTRNNKKGYTNEN